MTDTLPVREKQVPYQDDVVPPESVLQDRWKNLQFPCEFVTLSGQTITVLDGGRHNHNAGPDFKSGIIKIGDRALAGDIEVHRSVDGWKAHRHGDDPRFRNVILHVIGTLPETQQDYGTFFVPNYTVVFTGWKEKPVSNRTRYRCRKEAIGPKSITLVWQLGLQRIAGKAGTYCRLVRSDVSEEQLWLRKTMRCLGYGCNSDLMEALGDSLGFDEIREFAYHFTEEQLFEIALGITGYHEYFSEKTPVWEALSADLSLEALKYYQWKPLRSRPANHPVLRLYQLLTNAEAWYENYIAGTADIRKTHRSLKSKVPVPERYREYFGVRTASLGSSRAVELLVNAWIPLWCRDENPNRLPEIQSLAEPLPEIPVYSVLRRFIRSTGWAEVLSDSRLHPVLLQGILHLRNRLCTTDACTRCPMLEGEK